MEYWDGKRYHTWNFHLRQMFGEKVFKVPLDGGFTCPNRDGTLTTGGCTFCSARGSGDFAGSRRLNLHRQFEMVRSQMHNKWPNAKYIAYFQAFSNTYAPAHVLREMYETALAFPGVIGLSIATRPDCLPEDVLELLAEMNERTYLWVELGLQSVHERTSQRINRAHDTPNFLRAVFALNRLGIRTCTHIIYGLPGETDEMMLQTANLVAHMPTQGIKLHLLHLLKGTPMAAEYDRGEFELLTQERYTSLICDSLEMLPPDMIIHRLTGDGPPNILIGPMWSRQKWNVLNGIDAEMARRDSWQGKLWDGETWDTSDDWAHVDFAQLPNGVGIADWSSTVGLRAKYPVYVPHASGMRPGSSLK